MSMSKNVLSYYGRVYVVFIILSMTNDNITAHKLASVIRRCKKFDMIRNVRIKCVRFTYVCR